MLKGREREPDRAATPSLCWKRRREGAGGASAREAEPCAQRPGPRTALLLRAAGNQIAFEQFPEPRNSNEPGDFGGLKLGALSTFPPLEKGGRYNLETAFFFFF